MIVTVNVQCRCFVKPLISLDSMQDANRWLAWLDAGSDTALLEAGNVGHRPSSCALLSSVRSDDIPCVSEGATCISFKLLSQTVRDWIGR